MKRISLIIIPDAGQRRDFRVPEFAFKLAIGLLAAMLLVSVAAVFFFGSYLNLRSEVSRLVSENAELEGYAARVSAIEKELERNREMTNRILENAGFDVAIPEVDRSSLASLDEPIGEDVGAPFWQKNQPFVTSGAFFESGPGRVPIGLPVSGYVTRGFNPEPSILKPRHSGMDIAVREGTPVMATASGIVDFAGWDHYLGYTIRIDHHNGFKTLYGHNRSLEKGVGDIVAQAEIIAFSGNTGYSTGPHLHYEVIKEGEPIDPEPFVRF